MSSNLPTKLPPPRFPIGYESARVALSECARVDECKEWADKAEALSSYAKQAKDDSMRKLADRIQARAIRRAGELLKEFDARGGDRSKNGSAPTSAPSRQEAGKKAGMSRDQQVTAVRVANVPDADFEEAVESDDPPTVTQLAEAGKSKRPLVDLEGRSPNEYAKATEAHGTLRRLAAFAEATDPASIVRGTKQHEMAAMAEHIEIIANWLKELKKCMRQAT